VVIPAVDGAITASGAVFWVGSGFTVWSMGKSIRHFYADPRKDILHFKISLSNGFAGIEAFTAFGILM
jgi:hypothetical protein